MTLGTLRRSLSSQARFVCSGGPSRVFVFLAVVILVAGVFWALASLLLWVFLDAEQLGYVGSILFGVLSLIPGWRAAYRAVSVPRQPRRQ